MKISDRLFGQYEGEPVIQFSLINDTGMTVSCLNYGCVITQILVPDRFGVHENVVLGFDDFSEYLKWSPYFGAVVGRVAGRISNAKFELDGKEYILDTNEPPNHLHGGWHGFSSAVWQAEKLEEENAVGMRFFNKSVDGEAGYPGNLETTVTYLLTNDNELRITFEAQTDQKTPVNLTNHSYFNLSGNLKRNILRHELHLDSAQFLELAPDLIPTGKRIETEGTAFDFRKGRMLSDGVDSENPQNILVGNGYDHPLVLADPTITLSEPESGRGLKITTDQPCVVLYTANQLEGPFSISGTPATNYLGVCLETQGFPDAVNHPEFPSIILEPGEKYRQNTIYRFICQKAEGN